MVLFLLIANCIHTASGSLIFQLSLPLPGLQASKVAIIPNPAIEFTMNKTNQYWFRAKQYGWGWGLPNTWHGWVVLALFVVALTLVFNFFPPATDLVFFSIGVAVTSALLVAVCFIKGEPPKWRWGNK